MRHLSKGDAIALKDKFQGEREAIFEGKRERESASRSVGAVCRRWRSQGGGGVELLMGRWRKIDG